MRFLKFALLPCLALASFAVATASAETDEKPTLRVLYVTGGGYHDYEGQTELITSALSERANIEWTIDSEAGTDNTHKLTRFEDPNWNDEFDAVIYNMCFAAVEDVDYIKRITSAHYEDGTGAIVLHCTMHTFRDAEGDDWQRFLGLRTYHHEAEQREISIKALDKEHPILAEFPASGWVSPKDEIYIVQETYENLVPLALGYGEETKKHHVVMWTNTYGKARIVGTTAGHNNAVIADPVYLDFLTRGLLWTTGNLSE